LHQWKEWYSQHLLGMSADDASNFARAIGLNNAKPIGRSESLEQA
jgi:hypothetical protein